MPKLIFLPSKVDIDVNPNTKVLAAAIKAKVGIRFGCAACRCGTCGIKQKSDGELSPMGAPERDLLEQIGLPTTGEVRLACQTKIISGTTEVDLAFQNQYSPDTGLD